MSWNDVFFYNIYVSSPSIEILRQQEYPELIKLKKERDESIVEITSNSDFTMYGLAGVIGIVIIVASGIIIWRWKHYADDQQQPSLYEQWLKAAKRRTTTEIELSAATAKEDV